MLKVIERVITASVLIGLITSIAVPRGINDH